MYATHKVGSINLMFSTVSSAIFSKIDSPTLLQAVIEELYFIMIFFNLHYNMIYDINQGTKLNY